MAALAGSRSPIDFSASFRRASSLVYGLTLLLVVAFDEAFFGVRVRGRKNLRLPRALLVSNHSLYLDPAIVAHAIRPRRTLFSAMQRTFRVPALGAFIRLLGAFPVPAEHAIERLRSAVERAAALYGFVHFFPEGRLRHGRRDVSGFHDGVFLLSVLTGIPVVPVVVVATRRRFLGRDVRSLPPRVDVVVGRAVHPDRFRAPGVRPREGARRMNRCVRAAMRSVLLDAQDGRRRGLFRITDS
jgi:1-acyl-sn-glycerol-3-phosphate acyltransferase